MSDQSLRDLTFVLSSVSVFFESLTLIILFLIKGFKKTRYELLMHLAFICLMSNLAFLLPIYEDDKRVPVTEFDYEIIGDVSSICKVQSYFILFTEQSKILLSIVVSYNIYISAIKSDFLEENIKTLRITILASSIIVPSIFSIM